MEVLNTLKCSLPTRKKKKVDSNHLQKDKMPLVRILWIIFFDIFPVVADSSTDLYNGYTLYQEGHKTIGLVAIGLVWLPGFLFCIWIIFRVFILRISTIKEGLPLIIIGGFLNPIFIPFIYGYAVYLAKTNQTKKSNEIFVYSIFFKCLEGIAEAAPQLTLNCYFFATRGFFHDNGDFEYIPMIAAIFSILSITKTSAENHFIEISQQCPTLGKILKAIPLFLVHVLFRTLLYGVLVAYFREYTLVVWSVAIAISWGLAKKINKTHVICTTWTSIGSIFSTIAFKHIEKGVVTGPGYLNLPQILAYYFANTLVTFIIGMCSLFYLIINSYEGMALKYHPIPEISCYPYGSNITLLSYGRICDDGEESNYYLQYVILPLFTVYGLFTVVLSFTLMAFSRINGQTIQPLIQIPGEDNWEKKQVFISTYPKFLSIGNGWKAHWKEDVDNNVV